MIHTGAWFIWTACASLIAMATTNPFYLLPLFAVGLVVYAAHRRESVTDPFRLFLLFGIATLVIRTALVALGPVTREALAAALLEGLRLAVMLCIYGVFNSVTNPEGFLRLAPRRFHEPALAAALALSIAPRTISAVGRVKEAQRLRGIHVARWRSLPALAVPVLETGMEQAVTLAESMDARGHGRRGRSRYRPDAFSAASWIVATSAIAAAVSFAVSALATPADLSVSTYPLTWPAVSLGSIGAIGLFCVAAFVRKGRER